MRILLSAFASIFVLFSTSSAFAYCKNHSIGTSRVIELDPNKHHSFHGREASLGLRDKEVILTFDDGPIKGKTNKILKVLKDECVKATFFAVGKMARAYPKLTKQIVREGHTLAHHTFDHNRLPKYSIKNASAHIDRGIAMVEKAAYGGSIGKPEVPFFRFPYLAASKATRKLIRDRKLIAFGTNIDSLDWKKDSPNTIVNRVMKQLKREKKGIILMHDIHNRTALMLPKLLKRLNDEGYKIVHMVPYKGGDLIAGTAVDNTIATASIAPSKREMPKWDFRKSGEISSNFIISYDKVEDINMALVSNHKKVDVTKHNDIENKPLKLNKKLIKKWALRSALASM